jgi:hypothetical protein
MNSLSHFAAGKKNELEHRYISKHGRDDSLWTEDFRNPTLR